MKMVLLILSGDCRIVRMAVRPVSQWSEKSLEGGNQHLERPRMVAGSLLSRKRHARISATLAMLDDALGADKTVIKRRGSKSPLAPHLCCH